MTQAYIDSFIQNYLRKTISSKKKTQTYRTYMADSRASAGFRFSIKEMLYPILASRGQGSHFFDIDDNKYVDITMGYGTLLFGHSYPPIIESVQEQLNAGVQLGPQIDKAGEVAELICKITGIDRVAFCNSGTEANMTAIRLARLATDKNKIIVFQDSYHGFYDATLVGASDNLGIPKPLFEGFPQSLIEDIIILPYGNIEALELLITHKEKIAGVIVEPVRSRFPEVRPVEFLNILRKLTEEIGAALIFDEVITGFRCDIGGAQSYFGIKADIVTYGKIIGGGLPIGIVGGKRGFLDGIDGGTWQYNDKSFPIVSTTFFGGTFFKNPLSIAAASGVISQIQKLGPTLQSSLTQKTEELAKEINVYCENFNLPLQVVNFSSLFRFKSNINLDLFFYHLLYKGLYVWEGKNFFLSTAHSEEDVKFIRDTVLESLDDLRKVGIITPTNVQNSKFAQVLIPTSSIVLKIKSLLSPPDLKSLWYLSQLQEAASIAYNESIILNITGPLDKNSLQFALIEVVKRHESLRIQFSEDGEFITFIDNLDVELEYLAPQDKNFPSNSYEFKEFLKLKMNQPFNLSQAPLFSFHLLKFNSNNHILLIITHHTIMDGQSSNIFLKELFYIYENCVKEDFSEVLSVPTQFSTYLESKGINDEDRDESQNYWIDVLKTSYEPLTLKNSKSRPSIKTYQGGHVTFKIDKDIENRVKELGSTLFTVLLSALNILIYRYTNQRNFIIGVPASNRRSSQQKNTVGYATTVYPIRAQVNPEIEYQDYLNLLKKETYAIYDYPYFDINTAIKKIGMQWDQGRASPVFDVILNIEGESELPRNTSIHTNIVSLHSPYQKLDLYDETMYLESGKSKFDLAFNLQVGSEGIDGCIEFSKDLFDEESIKLMSEQLLVVLKSIIENPSLVVGNIPLLTSEEEKLLLDLDKEIKIKKPEKALHQFFEEQAKKTPDAIALKFGKEVMSYQQLNKRSNQLAHYLREQGVTNGSLVAIFLDRSFDLIVGILGILKAGAAYVPIDPSYPDARKKYMLEDSKTEWLITLGSLKRSFENYPGKLVLLDDSCWESKTPEKNLNIQFTPEDLAYVIYTSGSTGKSKGTLISHSNVVRLLTSTEQLYSFSSRDIWVLFHSIAFDFSVWEIWGTLLYGGSLVIVSYLTSRSPEEFHDLLVAEKVTILNQTPSAFKQLLQYEATKDTNELKVLRLIIFGGEPLEISSLKPWLDKYGETTQLVNMYGITETTVHSTYKFLNKKDIEKNSNKSLIGVPLPDLQIYLLDEDKRLVPKGVPGEIYVAGRGLSIGYLNREELTSEKFIENSFLNHVQRIQKETSGEDTRLYKSGDLAKYLPNGELEYLGRIDEQVKIRGYRAELDEISLTINRHESVLDSIVLLQENDMDKQDKFLVAYLVLKPSVINHLNFKIAEKGDHELEVLELGNEREFVEELKYYLSQYLTNYMIPSHFMFFNALPITNNGKIDKKRLRTLGPNSNRSEKTTDIPRTRTEQEILSIWSKVLGTNQIGINDNFFSLGGHSLKATKIISLIRNKFKINLHLKALFDSPTIAGLAGSIENLQVGKDSFELERVDDSFSKVYPLSFAQERLWFIENFASGTNAYHIPAAFKISPKTKIDILEKSLKAVVSRHEVLRTVICEDESGKSYQRVLDEQKVPLQIGKHVVKNFAALDEAIEVQANRVFDLSNEHPINISFYELHDKVNKCVENYLVLVIHHIAFDGWSINIFLRDLSFYYDKFIHELRGEKTTVHLPILKIQYKDFSKWQREYLDETRLEKQILFWKEKLLDYQALNLVTDNPRPNVVSYEGGYAYFDLDEVTSSALRKLAKELHISMFSLLLSVYYLMLRAFSNQDDIVIGSPVANRHYDKVENLIGFFVNSLVLRSKINSNMLLTDYIVHVWKEVICAQENQDLPFERLVDELELEKDTSRHPIFQVQFGVQDFGSNMECREKGSDGLISMLDPYQIEGKLYTVSQFDLVTFLENSEKKLKGSFNYAKSLFHAETVHAFIETYKTLLKQISILAGEKEKQKIVKVADLKYVDKEGLIQLVDNFNQTEKAYPSDKTIQKLFEEQVEKTPGNIALVCNGSQLSYRELNSRANQLANYLQERFRLNPNTLVVLCMDRDAHMIVSLLAILKASAAYVPIDPSYPEERIRYILSDSNSNIVLTVSSYKDKISSIVEQKLPEQTEPKNDGLNFVLIDHETTLRTIEQHSTENPISKTQATNLAYVIYTSGTTGMPKGILMPHQVISKISCWDTIELSEEPIRVSQFASISFDVSIQEISYALLKGHGLYIIPEETKKSFDCLVDFINKNKINRMYFPSTALSVLAEEITDKGYSLKHLSTIIVSGEELSITPQIKTCFEKRPWMSLVNQYGPSETHLVTSYTLPSTFSHWQIFPPLGKPIDNTQFYILDKHLNLLPRGAVGELYIGGDGLARGYINKEEMTKARFIQKPLLTKSKKRELSNEYLYKSGDLVRWFPDGSLKFMGRNDHQVKIRGYRIELGEVEAVLGSYEGIKQTAVIPKDPKTSESLNGTKYLIGYYVADSEINENDILVYMKSRLPDYMVPNVLVHLDNFPLTSNGKLDKSSLPEPTLSGKKSRVMPRNELEREMCKIWAEILGLLEEEIGIQDDFFRLGGNSILAIRLASKINKHYNCHLRVADLFVRKDIKSILSLTVKSKEIYKAIVKLNNTYDKPNMFMIHPGEAGCEVYVNLADRLSNVFSCYGIDSYNLYNEKKIKELHKLAEYYLNHIERVMEKTGQDTYHLLGWSLGGVLSIEIAGMLEKRGIANIKVYLLDAIIEDEYLSKLMDTIDMDEVKQSYKKYQITRGYDESYIEKIISLVSIEKYMIRLRNIDSILQTTCALLFKAMLQDENDLSFQTSEASQIHKYIHSLQYNNIDKVIINMNNLKLVKVTDAYHKDIVQKEKLIISEIESFNNTKLNSDIVS